MKKLTYLSCIVLFLASCGGGNTTNSEGEEGREEESAVATETSEESGKTEKSKWSNPENYAEIISMYNMQDELSKPVPKKSEVPIAAYSGAIILNWDSGMEIGEKKYGSMKLASSDAVDKVKGFYEKELAGWTYKNTYDIHTWDKDPSAGPMQTSHVEVGAFDAEENDFYTEYLDNPVTLITVYYEM